MPGGFGHRGIEGMIRAARYARENAVPYLGLCLGMQIMASSSPATSLGLEDANSTEFNMFTPYPVIDLLPEQRDLPDKGGTMRLGLYPVPAAGRAARRSTPTASASCSSGTATASSSTTSSDCPLSAPGMRSAASRRMAGWWRSPRSRATRGWWAASSTPSSAPGPTGRTRCSAGSSAPAWRAPRAARATPAYPTNGLADEGESAGGRGSAVLAVR